jgi:hypothetical protein
MTVALVTSASAQQGYIINRPGGPMTFVNPNSNGGYTMITPGGPTSFANPTPNGGYVVTTPGYGTTFINPTGPQQMRPSDSFRNYGNDDDDD